MRKNNFGEAELIPNGQGSDYHPARWLCDFSPRGDLVLLGSRAMEGTDVRVDARRKRLVAAGPFVAALGIFPLVSAAGF
jgi:hypothetical protein